MHLGCLVKLAIFWALRQVSPNFKQLRSFRVCLWYSGIKPPRNNKQTFLENTKWNIHIIQCYMKMTVCHDNVEQRWRTLKVGNNHPSNEDRAGGGAKGRLCPARVTFSPPSCQASCTRGCIFVQRHHGGGSGKPPGKTE